MPGWLDTIWLELLQSIDHSSNMVISRGVLPIVELGTALFVVLRKRAVIRHGILVPQSAHIAMIQSEAARDFVKDMLYGDTWIGMYNTDDEARRYFDYSTVEYVLSWSGCCECAVS